MPGSLEVQLAQRGVIVLPKRLRDKYNLKPGDSITIIDLDGTLVLSPGRSKIDALADDIRQSLVEHGETLESMLKALREERERYAGGG